MVETFSEPSVHHSTIKVEIVKRGYSKSHGVASDDINTPSVPFSITIGNLHEILFKNLSLLCIFHNIWKLFNENDYDHY